MASIEVDVGDLEEVPMDAEVMELKLDLLKVVATTARQFKAPALCPPVGAAQASTSANVGTGAGAYAAVAIQCRPSIARN